MCRLSRIITINSKNIVLMYSQRILTLKSKAFSQSPSPESKELKINDEVY